MTARTPSKQPQRLQSTRTLTRAASCTSSTWSSARASAHHPQLRLPRHHRRLCPCRQHAGTSRRPRAVATAPARVAASPTLTCRWPHCRRRHRRRPQRHRRRCLLRRAVATTRRRRKSRLRRRCLLSCRSDSTGCLRTRHLFRLHRGLCRRPRRPRSLPVRPRCRLSRRLCPHRRLGRRRRLQPRPRVDGLPLRRRPRRRRRRRRRRQSCGSAT